MARSNAVWHGSSLGGAGGGDGGAGSGADGGGSGGGDVIDATVACSSAMIASFSATSLSLAAMVARSVSSSASSALQVQRGCEPKPAADATRNRARTLMIESADMTSRRAAIAECRDRLSGAPARPANKYS